MILNDNEINGALKEVFGETPNEIQLQFMENITDTITDLKSKATNNEDWERRYKENENAWRARYAERFYKGGCDSGNPIVNEEYENEKENPAEKISINDLFIEKR